MPTPFLLNGILASQISGHLYSGPTGAFDALGSVTVGAGGQSSITFSAIPQTWTHLQIRMLTQATATGPLYMKMNFNGDTGNNYSYHELTGNGSTAAAGAGSSVAFAVAADGISSTPGFNGGIVDILDYASTTKAKTSRSLSGQDNNGSGYVYLASSGWYNNTAGVYPAINSIVLTMSSGNFAQYSNFSLYGIR